MSFEFHARNTIKTRMAAYMGAPMRNLTDYSFLGRKKRVEQWKPVKGETLADAAAKRLQFGQFYFPSYLTFDLGDFHQPLMESFQVRGRLVVDVLPRNAGKGTMAFIDNMYDIAYATENYIIRIEHDGKAAKDESFKIAHEWTTNFQLMRDFPHVVPGATWRPAFGELRFQHGVRFQSVGLKELVRGRTELQSRISKVQVNDPVKNAQEARSAVHSQDVHDLVMRSVAKAGGSLQEEPISYCVLGTCQARGDALDRLVQSPMAKVLKVPALIGHDELITSLLDVMSSHAQDMRVYCDDIENTKGNVTPEDREQYFRNRWETFGTFFDLLSYWPARFPLADLFFDAATDTGGFAQEMLHLTEDVKYIKFQDEWFLNWDGNLPPGEVTYALTIDPSGEPSEGTDPMAIIAGAFHNDLKEGFVLEAWCDQASPGDMVEKTYEIFHRCFPGYVKNQYKVNVYMEDIVSFKGVGSTLFESKRIEKIQAGKDPSYWIKLPLQFIRPGSLGNKMARILSVRPIAEQGRIHVMRGHSQQDLMLKQFNNFDGRPTHRLLPPEFKVDLLDAFQMWWVKAPSVKKMKPFAAYGSE